MNNISPQKSSNRNPITSTTVETAYVWKGNVGELSFNEYNAHCYVDMVEDMKILGNGVFTATIKIDFSNICDYVLIESDSYVDPVPPEGNKVHRR